MGERAALLGGDGRAPQADVAAPGAPGGLLAGEHLHGQVDGDEVAEAQQRVGELLGGPGDVQRAADRRGGVHQHVQVAPGAYGGGDVDEDQDESGAAAHVLERQYGQVGDQPAGRVQALGVRDQRGARGQHLPQPGGDAFALRGGDEVADELPRRDGEAAEAVRGDAGLGDAQLAVEDDDADLVLGGDGLGEGLLDGHAAGVPGRGPVAEARLGVVAGRIGSIGARAGSARSLVTLGTLVTLVRGRVPSAGCRVTLVGGRTGSVGSRLGGVVGRGLASVGRRGRGVGHRVLGVPLAFRHDPPVHVGLPGRPDAAGLEPADPPGSDTKPSGGSVPGSAAPAVASGVAPRAQKSRSASGRPPTCPAGYTCNRISRQPLQSAAVFGQPGGGVSSSLSRTSSACAAAAWSLGVSAGAGPSYHSNSTSPRPSQQLTRVENSGIAPPLDTPGRRPGVCPRSAGPNPRLRPSRLCRTGRRRRPGGVRGFGRPVRRPGSRLSRVTTVPRPLRELIETGPLAHLSTVNPDGSPQVTVIWIGLDGEDIVSGHMNLSRKVRNVRRDPRVVLSFQAPPVPGAFLAEHAVVHATATVQEGGARELLTRLGRLYVAPDFSFPVPPDADGYVLRYSVERVGGVGPWAPRPH